MVVQFYALFRRLQKHVNSKSVMSVFRWNTALLVFVTTGRRKQHMAMFQQASPGPLPVLGTLTPRGCCLLPPYPNLPAASAEAPLLPSPALAGSWGSESGSQLDPGLPSRGLCWRSLLPFAYSLIQRIEYYHIAKICQSCLVPCLMPSFLNASMCSFFSCIPFESLFH